MKFFELKLDLFVLVFTACQALMNSPKTKRAIGNWEDRLGGWTLNKGPFSVSFLASFGANLFWSLFAPIIQSTRQESEWSGQTCEIHMIIMMTMIIIMIMMMASLTIYQEMPIYQWPWYNMIIMTIPSNSCCWWRRQVQTKPMSL